MSKFDPDDVAKRLGATPRGEVTATAGHLGALGTAARVQNTLKQSRYVKHRCCSMPKLVYDVESDVVQVSCAACGALCFVCSKELFDEMRAMPDPA